jgi:HEPN domain-containing protein
MKAKADLVRGWLRKAESDRVAMEASLDAGAYDAACFHAQQAVEKLLKAFLIHSGLPLIHTHNLATLLEACASVEPAFRSLADVVAPLTPYAVEVRYDDDFWPSAEAAEEARAAARNVRDFLRSYLPEMGCTAATYTGWQSARESFDWKVDLKAFQHREDYPGHFDRIIEPAGVTAFEDQFRSAVESGCEYQRAGEVYFWKTFDTPGYNKKTLLLLQHLSDPERWNSFRKELRALADDPAYANFERFREACGQGSGFATQICFLASYNPRHYPMADKHIASWWRDYLDRTKQDLPRFCQREDGWIMPCAESWRAYLAWTEFCRRQGERLTVYCDRDWRPRDVEMAVWAAQKESIRLEPL